MDKYNTSLATFFFVLILSQAKAFNITTLLGHYSSFSDFNNYLTQTGVAAAINSRQTITVLVVENNNLSPLAGKSQDVLANIMRVHVLLDYFDIQKLQKLPNKTVKVPTLFQTTGHANNDQGFLNMTDLGSGSISLGSAAKGETLGSNLVKSIASQPFNISILQISNVIIPLGIESSTFSPPSSPPPRAPAPSPRKHHSPAPSPAPITGGPTSSLAPSPNRPSAAPAPGAGTLPAPEPAAAKTPAEASPAPTPHGSPPKPDAPTADTPTGDAPTADTPADAPPPAPTGDHDSSSANSALGVSLVVVVMLNLFLVLVI
ncbi:fasciclin-like arabinogalactan protein 14 [Capsicum chacoense]